MDNKKPLFVLKPVRSKDVLFKNRFITFISWFMGALLLVELCEPGILTHLNVQSYNMGQQFILAGLGSVIIIGVQYYLLGRGAGDFSYEFFDDHMKYNYYFDPVFFVIDRHITGSEMHSLTLPYFAVEEIRRVGKPYQGSGNLSDIYVQITSPSLNTAFCQHLPFKRKFFLKNISDNCADVRIRTILDEYYKQVPAALEVKDMLEKKIER